MLWMCGRHNKKHSILHHRKFSNMPFVYIYQYNLVLGQGLQYIYFCLCMACLVRKNTMLRSHDVFGILTGSCSIPATVTGQCFTCRTVSTIARYLVMKNKQTMQNITRKLIKWNTLVLNWFFIFVIHGEILFILSPEDSIQCNVPY